MDTHAVTTEETFIVGYMRAVIHMLQFGTARAEAGIFDNERLLQEFVATLTERLASCPELSAQTAETFQRVFAEAADDMASKAKVAAWAPSGFRNFVVVPRKGAQ